MILTAASNMKLGGAFMHHWLIYLDFSFIMLSEEDDESQSLLIENKKHITLHSSGQLKVIFSLGREPIVDQNNWTESML